MTKRRRTLHRHTGLLLLSLLFGTLAWPVLVYVLCTLSRSILSRDNLIHLNRGSSRALHLHLIRLSRTLYPVVCASQPSEAPI